MAFSSQGATTLLQPLDDLRAASDTAAVSQVLKKIKYELSGHLARKVDYIRHGLIRLLDKSLADLVVTPPTDDNELAFTHVAQVLCIIAHGTATQTTLRSSAVTNNMCRRPLLCPAHP